MSIIFFYSKGEDWQWTITLPLMYWTLRSGNILETLTREAHLSHLISSDLISLLRFVSRLTPQPLRLTDFVAGLNLVAWKICRFCRLSLICKKNPLNKTLEPKNSKIPAKYATLWNWKELLTVTNFLITRLNRSNFEGYLLFSAEITKKLMKSFFFLSTGGNDNGADQEHWTN